MKKDVDWWLVFWCGLFCFIYATILMLVIYPPPVRSAPLPFPKPDPDNPLIGGWFIDFRYGMEDESRSTIEFMADGTGRLWHHGETYPKSFLWSYEPGFIGIKDTTGPRYLWGIKIKNLKSEDVTVAGVPAKMRRIK
jgi:hypothetical protein